MLDYLGDIIKIFAALFLFGLIMDYPEQRRRNRNRKTQIKNTMNYKKLKSFEDCLSIKGETLEHFQERTKGMDADTVGYEKCKVIVFAINGGKHVKRGYYPYFYNTNRSVAGFSYCDCGDGDSAVGARFLLETAKQAEYAGKTFTNEYSEHING